MILGMRMLRPLFPTVLMLGVLAWAQAQESQTTQDSAENKVFRVDVNIVQVDAVVTDKEGRPVTDLTAEDFSILQDGKPQKITNFSLVRLKDSDVPRPVVKKPLEKSREAIPPPPPPSARLNPDRVRRVIAIVVDDLGLSFANTILGEIAQELVVAVSTVKTHINHIYGKLAVKSRIQAVAKAQALDLL